MSGQPAARYPQPPDAGAQGASVIAHLSAPIAFVLSAGSLSVLGPLIVWFVYRDRSPAARQAAAGAFNFNVAFWIVYVVAWVFILTIVGALVGVPLLVVAFVVSAWCHLRGAMLASRGESYRYPFQIPILH